MNETACINCSIWIIFVVETRDGKRGKIYLYFNLDCVFGFILWTDSTHCNFLCFLFRKKRNVLNENVLPMHCWTNFLCGIKSNVFFKCAWDITEDKAFQFSYHWSLKIILWCILLFSLQLKKGPKKLKKPCK